jgi:hypothetical protein
VGPDQEPLAQLELLPLAQLLRHPPHKLLPMAELVAHQEVVELEILAEQILAVHQELVEQLLWPYQFKDGKTIYFVEFLY